MRIVFVSSGLSADYGGAAVSESSLIYSLSKHHQIDVFCEEKRLDPVFAKSKGIPCVIEFSTVDTFIALEQDSHWLNRMIREADCVHLNGHWRVNTYFWAKLCKKNQKPYILHPRGMSLVGQRKIYFKKLYNEVMGNYIFENASAIIALSHFETRHYANYPVDFKKVHVIPNGITIPTIKKNALKTQTPYFLYLGRLEHRKNLLFLIDAFAYFVKNKPEYRLKLRGPVEKGYNTLVKKQIESLHLEKEVEVLPPLYDESKWEEIHDSQAVIYPSVEEAFGRVPFEALASKTFTIVPKDSGSGEYLEALLPDCIFDLNNTISLTETMNNVAMKAKNSIDLERAFNWVKKELDWETISKINVELYSEVAGE